MECVFYTQTFGACMCDVCGQLEGQLFTIMISFYRCYFSEFRVSKSNIKSSVSLDITHDVEKIMWTPLVNIPVANFLGRLVIQMSRAGKRHHSLKSQFLHCEYIVFNVKYQKFKIIYIFVVFHTITSKFKY